jgi:hypothetical protein
MQGRGHRGGGDEHGPRDGRLLGGGDDARSVAESERRQTDQGLAAGAGERLVEAAGIVEVAGQRPRAAIGHGPGRRRAADQRHGLVAKASRLAEHVAAEEAAPADDQQPHRDPPGASMSLRYSRASMARSKCFST